MKPIFLLLGLGLGLAACAPVGIPTPVMHPTGDVSRHSVGVAAGGLYATGEGDTSVLMLPHAEGWVRVPAGAGQVELQVRSGLLALGYRAEVKPLRSGFGLSLVPAVHGSYVRSSSGNDITGDETTGAIFVGASMKVLLMFPVGGSFLYLAPGISITHAASIGDPADADSDSENLLGLGGAIGFDLGTSPIAASIEVGIQRLTSFDDDADAEVWMFAPTLGLRL